MTNVRLRRTTRRLLVRGRGPALVAALAALSLIGVAGCSGGSDPDADTKSTPDAASSTRTGTFDPDAIKAGKEQTLLGPSNDIDSLYATVRDKEGMHAYVSNERTVWYDQDPNGNLSNPRVILRKGPKGAPDYCGVHPTGAIYKATAKRWISFYHGERANPHQYNGECYAGPGKRNFTRWAVFALTSKDGGKTWEKGRSILTQDKDFLQWRMRRKLAMRDDAGSPRVVEHGKYLYMFFRAVNKESPDKMLMSVARAPKKSLGEPDAWKKYYKGSYSQSALGGHQSAIPGLPAAARGISWNTYLKSFVSVIANERGIDLYASAGEDLTKWHHLKQVVGEFTSKSAWGKHCIPGKTPDFPVAIGYGATIGWKGSATDTGKNFWIYYMKKPKGKCFNERYLLRLQVALDGKLLPEPEVTINTETPH